MKTKLSTASNLTLLSALAGLCVLASPAKADWGSIRANNRPEHRTEPAHRELERVRERRRMDIEPERRHGFYWSGFHPGMVIAALPFGYVQASAGMTGYYYYDGVFFQPTTESEYTVVAAPVGAVVPQLPEGAEPLVLGPTTYYYAGGAFYLQQPNGFMIVPAPSGATVTDIPAGATPVTINGVLYLQSGSTYFQPVMQGGVTVYTTARP